MPRHTAFRYALNPTAAQERQLWRYAGASRFAYNQGLRLVQDALTEKQVNSAHKVPWSGFDLINTFNAWKISEAAGVDAEGRKGLPWRREVCAQVFEEALVDLGRGLKRFFDDREEGRKHAVRFPKPKKKRTARASFRLRNKRDGLRVDVASVALPKLGEIRVHGSTRKVRRLLCKNADGMSRAKLLFATVSHDGRRWYVSLNIEAPDFHPARLIRTEDQNKVTGIDVGLTTFAVAATSDGREVWRNKAPKPLRALNRKLRRAAKALSRKKEGSRNRNRARCYLARVHGRISDIRRNHLHQLSSFVAKTHGHVALEDLHVAGMLKNHTLARHISDAAWGRFGAFVTYKARWYGCEVTWVPRFEPTTKRCSQCQHRVPSMTLSERWFVCPMCHFEADRDTNAAASCAAWAERNAVNVAGKPPETQNGCREEGAGVDESRRETVLDEAAIDTES